MYMRAGLVALVLLLSSRVLGLVREAVQAAAFGTTGLADVTVAILTLPDLASAVLASGALAYALLPLWARLDGRAVAASQHQASRLLCLAGACIAGLMFLAPGATLALLAPGVPPALRQEAVAGMQLAAWSVPAALLSAVYYTRLQHEGDAVGMYGMNLVHTGAIVALLLVLATRAGSQLSGTVLVLAAGLLAALALRLGFLHWRLRRFRAGPVPSSARTPPAPLPEPSVWFWAVLATGIPVAIPLIGRTFASVGGEGALAAFNYAWKLVELPNVLAIQLIGALAFPAIAKAHAQGREYAVQARAALLLAWVIAWASACALSIGAVPFAKLLFGWGRMEADQVELVARWAAAGAWTLPAQAVLAVVLVVLATQGRLRTAAWAFALGAAMLVVAGMADRSWSGGEVMWALVSSLSVVAVLLVGALGIGLVRKLSDPALLVAPAASIAVAGLGRVLPPLPEAVVLALAAIGLGAVSGLGLLVSRELRGVLRR